MNGPPVRLPSWHLPGFAPARRVAGSGAAADDAAGPGEHAARIPGGLELRAPRLSGAEAGRVAHTVRAAALEARAARSVEDVVAAVARAGARLADPADDAGREAVALLVAELGWSESAAAETLRGMAAGWGAKALHRLLEAELGDLGVLDGFRPDGGRPGRSRRALGAPLQLLVQAGNVPGVAVTAIVRGLLARSGILARVSAGEPGLPALFARLLSEEDPLLGRSLAVTWWPSEAEVPAWSAWAERAGTVVVYGGDEAVAGVRSRINAATDLVVYGPRIGLAVLLPDAPAGAARCLARDVCAYEQRGCVSPRIAFVVGADPVAASEAVARELASEAGRAAPPPVGPDDAVRIRAARAEAEFAGLGENATATRVFGPDDLSWTVLARSAPGVESEPLPRVLWVYGMPDVESLLDCLAPFERRIQALGTAGSAGLERLAEGGAALGVSRVSPLGTMAWPPHDWRHEGRHQILPLLAWTDWEVTT